ncbi:MAG: hypothetical protein L3J41_06705 [Melioribacteraceae bacterium]|nr:hypothetical protein [Melioribacteraceae bacterium]
MNYKLRIKNYLFLPFSLVLFWNTLSFSQSIFEYKGYLTNLESVWLQKDIDAMLLSGTAQNRFDLFIYPMDNATINIGLRNILEYGNAVQINPYFADFVTSDEGYFNLTKSWRERSGYILYSTIDRLNIFYSAETFEIQLGRQRINWGVNFVWTPNDIFNSTSFLNFDYEEKEGSDAVRGQYYFGYTASLEFVYKIDREEEVTSSLMYRFNEWEYDFQMFVGMMEDDYVFGGGWSGSIMDANFSGELTYFRDKENFADTTGQLVLSLGATYTFASDFYIHGELLYNSVGTTENAGGILSLISNRYNAKNLSPAKYSLFGQLAYQVNPLVRLDLSSIINPSDKSFYIGPFATFSVSQSFDLLLGSQFFSGNSSTEWGDFGEFYFLKIKWSF